METNLYQTQNPAFGVLNCAPMAAASLETKKTEAKREDGKKGEFEPLIYQPHWITGGAKHPGLIVETPGLANVAPPPITYRPHLPHRLNNLNLISAFQFERVIYAGQAHSQRLSNGARAGISIGDGTGAGKDRKSVV